MIKCEVIKDFRLEKFDQLKNLIRGTGKNEKGKLCVKDIFECDEDMAKYLTGENKYKTAFVEIIEVVPEIKQVEQNIEQTIEQQPKKKSTYKKKSKKIVE